MRAPAHAVSAEAAFAKIKTQAWRYRLTVRTEPSQGSNTGSIPVKATNIRHYRLAPPRRSRLAQKETRSMQHVSFLFSRLYEPLNDSVSFEDTDLSQEGSHAITLPVEGDNPGCVHRQG